MCKIVAFSNAAKLPKKTPSVIQNELRDIERDGFGYAVQGESNVFGEKSVAHSYSSRFGKTIISLPFATAQTVTFGDRTKVTGPAIFHGRTSTNNKGLRNCHPMQRESWHLIHNGVVNDWGPTYKKNTTNDSEDLLHRLILGIDHVERELTGYYAFAAIAPDGRLHMGRDSSAFLFCAFSEQIDSYIFATTDALIKSIAKQLGFKLSTAIDKVTDDCYFIMRGNEMEHFQNIVPRGYSIAEGTYAKQSLGRDLGGSLAHHRPFTAPAKVITAQTVADKHEELLIESPDGRILDVSSATQDESRFNDNDEAMSNEDWADIYAQLSDSYSFYDSAGKTISIEEFHAMDWRDQMECNILRPNGKVLQRHGDRRSS